MGFYGMDILAPRPSDFEFKVFFLLVLLANKDRVPAINS